MASWIFRIITGLQTPYCHDKISLTTQYINYMHYLNVSVTVSISTSTIHQLGIFSFGSIKNIKNIPRHRSLKDCPMGLNYIICSQY